MEHNISFCGLHACGSYMNIWKPWSWGEISSLLLHMNCHAGCCQENARLPARPRACLVFLSHFCFSNHQRAACMFHTSSTVFVYIPTYSWSVSPRHSSTIWGSQYPFVRDLLLPSAFLVMWLHSIPYLCWSIFLLLLLLLPLIINGCLSKSFIIIFFWFVVLIFFPLGPPRCLAACLPATNSPFPWQPLAAWKWGRNVPVTLVMTYYWYHNALHVTLISQVVVVVTV